MKNLRTIWIALAAAAVAVLGRSGADPCRRDPVRAAQGRAEQALRGIADAQAEARESHGRYGYVLAQRSPTARLRSWHIRSGPKV